MFLFLLAINFGYAQDRKVKYEKTTEIDFEAIDITGEMIKPQGALIIDRERAAFNPLIPLRTDWNQEIKDSVRTIK